MSKYSNGRNSLIFGVDRRLEQFCETHIAGPAQQNPISAWAIIIVLTLAVLSQIYSIIVDIFLSTRLDSHVIHPQVLYRFAELILQQQHKCHHHIVR